MPDRKYNSFPEITPKGKKTTCFAIALVSSYYSSKIRGVTSQICGILDGSELCDPMILDEANPEPWGDLHLVAGGIVPLANALTLTDDWALIKSIATKYNGWRIAQGTFADLIYEFDIYGNDPQVASAVPEPVSIVLLMSGLAGLKMGRKRC